ncbi:hypothetical protein Tsubulata_046001 [Turnera subulata]|uniref:Uncharacterized protein n=1 Tax=Turnera subulata TaxID=218843 RepID=A0A9Q0G650_9ROSI|nr:hypothetical protein Tsubulata_046001 [Turnera subulata]
MSNFELCYAEGIDPVPEKEDWPKVAGEPCLPPQVMEEKKHGKRPMARRREEGEERAAHPYISTRRGTKIKCQNRLQCGHNILTCKHPRHPNAKPRKERPGKRKRGEGGERTRAPSNTNKGSSSQPNSSSIQASAPTTTSSSSQPLPTRRSMQQPSRKPWTLCKNFPASQLW